MQKAGEVPLVNFEKLQYGQHNVVDKAKARRFGLLCMMQATYMERSLGLCARLESAGIAQADSNPGSKSDALSVRTCKCSAGLSNMSFYGC